MGKTWWVAALCGLALGVAVTTIFFLNISLELSRYVLSGFVILAIASLISLFCIIWYSSHQRRKLGNISKQVGNVVGEIATLSEKGIAGLDESDQAKLASKAEVVVQYAVSIFATLRAFGFVFGAATVAVSAAILVATLMQVDRLDSQNQLAEASRRSALINELTAILDEIDEEIDASGTSEEELGVVNEGQAGQGPGFVTNGFTLSGRLVWRIIALSRSLRPYRFLEDKNLSERAFSPERGQLLVSLVASGVDLTEIFRGGDFEAAYLKGAELSNVNLRDTKLSNSNLRYANLITSDLSECSCRDVDFRDTVMASVQLKDADLTGSIFQNARIPHSNFFSGAKLDSVNLDGAIVGEKTWISDIVSLAEAPTGFAADEWIVEPESVEWFFNGVLAGKGYRVRPKNKE